MLADQKEDSRLPAPVCLDMARWLVGLRAGSLVAATKVGVGVGDGGEASGRME